MVHEGWVCLVYYPLATSYRNKDIIRKQITLELLDQRIFERYYYLINILYF